MSAEVSFSIEQGVGVVTLQRPTALNALNYEMMQHLNRYIKDWSVDSDVSAILIKGEGERAFCAGGDVRQMVEVKRSGSFDPVEFFTLEYATNSLIFHCPKPYVALLHGITMGGGLGVSVHGSHRVAAANLTMAMPETGIGFFPDVGASYFLSRMPGRFGLFIGLTGWRMDVANALYLGLVDHCVPESQFQELEAALKQTEWGDKPSAQIDACIAAYSQATKPEPPYDPEIVAQCFSHNSVPAILDALKKAGQDELVALLAKKSPLSLCVTFEQLERASKMDFDQCMAMELAMVKHFMAGQDFFEGVRAQVVDKDQAPKWQHQSIEYVTTAEVLRYFTE